MENITDFNSYILYGDILSDTQNAEELCRIIEQDSRRFSKAFTEELEVVLK